MASTEYSQNNCQSNQQNQTSREVFLAAYSHSSGNMYWTRYQASINKEIDLSFWQKVPIPTSVLEGIGIIEYSVPNVQSHLYLFYKTKSNFNYEFRYIRFNLLIGQWEEAEYRLDIGHSGNFWAKIKAGNRANRVPEILYSTANGDWFKNTLNIEGVDWSDRDPDFVQWGRALGSYEIQTYSQAGQRQVFTIRNSIGQLLYRALDDGDDGKWILIGTKYSALATEGLDIDRLLILARKDDLPKPHQLIWHSNNSLVHGTPLQISSISDLNNWINAVAGFGFDGLSYGEPGAERNLMDIFNDPNESKSRKIEISRHFSSDSISRFQYAWVEVGKLCIRLFKNYAYQSISLDQVMKRLIEGNPSDVRIYRRNISSEISYSGEFPTNNLSKFFIHREWISGTDYYFLYYSRLSRFSDLEIGDGNAPEAIAFGGDHSSFSTDKNLGVFTNLATDDNLALHIVAEKETRVRPPRLGYVSSNYLALHIHQKFIPRQVYQGYNVVMPLREYRDEALHFVPLLVANQLRDKGYFSEALLIYEGLFNYRAITDVTYINSFLRNSQDTSDLYERSLSWLLDPLNPFNIAEGRSAAHIVYVLIQISTCYLNYAEREFTKDDIEARSFARDLYQKAIQLFDAMPANACDTEKDQIISSISDIVPVPIAALFEHTLRSVPLAKVGIIGSDLSDHLDRDDSTHTALQKIDKLITEKLSPKDSSSLYEHADKKKVAYQQMIETHIMNGGIVSEMQSDSLLITMSEDADFTPTNYGFCIPENPLPAALKLQAEVNLYKLNHCLTIAGHERPDEIFDDSISASDLPTITGNGSINLPQQFILNPTNYRFEFLVEKAKQYVQIAQQIEGAFLSALEKRDAEAYQLMKARQEVQLSNKSLRLQRLRVNEAKDGVKLSELQRDRSSIQEIHYEDQINNGLNIYEQRGIHLLATASTAYTLATASGSWKFWKPENTISRLGQALSSWSSFMMQVANFERREQEWKFQKKLAQQDIRIGNQQIRISQDRLAITNQEYSIAQTQQDFARETLEYLSNKFTNVELYDWMSNVLEGVYSWFLSQATATAQLAQQQYEFQKREQTNIIQADYWEALSQNDYSLDDQQVSDRRGLTGSARLLQDVYELEQRALESNAREQQLTKVISLAQSAPTEFQMFRESGTMQFDTMMEWFDRDFPGHYLRQIKRVRISVIALVNPTDGIKATLSNKGLSRIVHGSDQLFQKSVLVAQPEIIAYTTPVNATGQFDFELQQQNEMLRPFEGLGVETSWTFEMSKASNNIDYTTIADVLLTIDYSALHSEVYKEQIIQNLGTDFSADRVFSLRNDFPDQWYDLNHPELVADDVKMKVTLTVTRQDFPANLNSINLVHIKMFFITADGFEESIGEVGLMFNGVTGQSSPVNNIISTASNATDTGSWANLIDGHPDPTGAWTLAFPFDADPGTTN